MTITNSELAHNWFHQVRDAESASNFFYAGKAIYSYGMHYLAAYLITLRTPRFVCGKEVDTVVAVNSTRYSVTTSRHLSLIRNAIDDQRSAVIHLPNNNMRLLHLENVARMANGDKYEESSVRHLLESVVNDITSVVRKNVDAFIKGPRRKALLINAYSETRAHTLSVLEALCSGGVSNVITDARDAWNAKLAESGEDAHKLWEEKSTAAEAIMLRRRKREADALTAELAAAEELHTAWATNHKAPENEDIPRLRLAYCRLEDNTLAVPDIFGHRDKHKWAIRTSKGAIIGVSAPMVRAIRTLNKNADATPEEFASSVVRLLEGGCAYNVSRERDIVRIGCHTLSGTELKYIVNDVITTCKGA